MRAAFRVLCVLPWYGSRAAAVRLRGTGCSARLTARSCREREHRAARRLRVLHPAGRHSERPARPAPAGGRLRRLRGAGTGAGGEDGGGRVSPGSAAAVPASRGAARPAHSWSWGARGLARAAAEGGRGARRGSGWSCPGWSCRRERPPWEEPSPQPGLLPAACGLGLVTCLEVSALSVVSWRWAAQPRALGIRVGAAWLPASPRAQAAVLVVSRCFATCCYTSLLPWLLLCWAVCSASYRQEALLWADRKLWVSM